MPPFIFRENKETQNKIKYKNGLKTTIRIKNRHGVAYRFQNDENVMCDDEHGKRKDKTNVNKNVHIQSIRVNHMCTQRNEINGVDTLKYIEF